jgi:hypothetical protein
MTPSVFPFRSSHSLAQTVKTLLIIGVVINSFEIISTGIAQIFPSVAEDGEFEDNAGGVIVLLLRLGLLLLSALIYVATGIVFLVWLHRSVKNLPAFGTPRSSLSYSPAWSVGSFFVPFANLVIPFKATRELWENSVPPEDNAISVSSPPASFYAWWTFWILCCIAGNLAFRAEQQELLSESGLEILGVIAETLTVVAGLLAFLVVGEIDQRQQSTSQRLELGQYARPPQPFQFAAATTPGPDQTMPQY